MGLKKLRELLTTTTEPEVIESEIYQSLIDAVKANLVVAPLVGLRIGSQSIPGTSIDVDLQDKNILTVQSLSEGQEIPLTKETVSTFNVKPLKYGLRLAITREMMEDSKFDMLAHQLDETGYQMARKLDSLLVAQIEAGDSSASNTVSGGTALVTTNITTAMNNLETNDYAPSDLILHPNVVADVRNIDTFVEADKAGITDPSKGLIGTIFGMRVHVTSQATANYAYVLDRRHALLLAEKRPITVERFDEVQRDLTGAAITARWGVRYLRDAANAVITTT